MAFMSASGGVMQYARRVSLVVVAKLLIDLAAAFVIITMVALITTGLIALLDSSRLTPQHVRRSAAILGLVYLAVIWTRALSRHWIVAGQVNGEISAGNENVTDRPSAQPSTPTD
jgi:hypothetical protein